jgi:serine/threonine-protein kinase
VIGTTVSHYTIVERLGGGGMGVVFKAEDTRLKRFVALKFLTPELTRDDTAKERFMLEAQAASALDHPHVCTIHEIDETPDGQVFICMAYVDGESLKSRLARGPLAIDEALVTATQIAEGLDQAHQHGIVHRDIKPANVMLTSDGTVKLVDFGLATLAGQARVTRTGQVVGTAAYMSPEQARGVAADQRSDLWSLGVVMYEMLAGHLPFAGGNEPGVLYAVLNEEIAPLESVRPGVPRPLAAVVARCLRKDPSERYQTAAELRTDLDCVRRTLSLATAPTSPGMAPAKPPRRRRLAIGVLGGALLVALAAAVALRPDLRALVHPAEASAHKVLAVLPFSNVGGDPSEQGFCDGLPESLTSRLTQLERYQVWVVPFSDVRDKGISSPMKARDALGVNLAITGFVQRDAGHVRVTLNVNRVDGPTARQISSKTIDESDAELYLLEDKAVWALAEMLDLELPRDARRKPLPGGTTVAAAQDSYLRAFGALHPSKGTPDTAAAVALFERAVALDPRFALAYAGLGEAYLAQYQTVKDPDLVAKAVAAGSRAADLDPTLPQVHATLGVIRLTKGDAEDAVREFELALVPNPADASALSGLARAYETLGRFGEAEAAYKRAIAAQPGLWPSYKSLAQFYLHRSRYPEAEALYRQAMALDPNNEWIANNLGALYFSAGRYPDARAMFERSIAIRPTYAAYSNFGTLAFVQKDWNEAIRRYEKACALDDRDYVVWGNTGIAYHWLGGHEPQAREALLTAVKLAERQLGVNPHDPVVLADLASYCATLGEKNRSRAYLAQIEAAGREQADLAVAIADVWADLGENDRAIAWIGTGLKLGFPAADIEQRPAFERLLQDPRVARLLRHDGRGAPR